MPDAEEIRDRCLAAVTRKMPTFEYGKEKGRFKNWLRRGPDRGDVAIIAGALLAEREGSFTLRDD